MTASLLNGLLGGSLIGLAAATLLLCNGDPMGASSIASSLLIDPRKTIISSSQMWKISFLGAMMVTTRLYSIYISACGGESLLMDVSTATTRTTTIVSPLASAVAGLLVGFGTRLGNGCTSGHGICGLARFSKRSLAAVCTFMVTGFLSASFCNADSCPSLRLAADDSSSSLPSHPNDTTLSIATILVSVISGMSVRDFFRISQPSAPSRPDQESMNKHQEELNNYSKLLPSVTSGSIFALGLIKSGMIYPSKIFGFLDVSRGVQGWDPTLAAVMMGGLAVSGLSYHFVRGHGYTCSTDYAIDTPLLQKKIRSSSNNSNSGSFANIPTSTVIDAKLLLGASMFGLGWGIGGMCPGPALVNAALGLPSVLFCWWPAFAVGANLGKRVRNHW